ncbi:phosphatase inhibitor-domain-containing protein [Ampelomyces quisqualis]|uniref:Type 1 phosphatases regulator n=1 Tax=Ampelomyces quisqualis TaxID=50730 RepID=A0A6A5R451_AMPQU|nr:phosphatase inhibitor-domain-containing protein [Ampelomyces quisqualis]
MSSQAAATRTATPAVPGGSTIVGVRPQPVLRLSAPSGVLRLRAEPTERRRIQWAEDVIDNEGMGKKSSKVCCIYHKPRAADESSDDDSSDSASSDSDSDSEIDNSTARPSGRAGGRPARRPHEHDHGDCEHDHNHGESSGTPPKRNRPRRKPSPNAYEKMPKSKK